MKLAIVTRADNNIKKMTDITFPFMKDYAKKCNADFIVYDHTPPVMTDDNLPHFRIMKTYETLLEYDRVLHLDADMAISPLCPNLFDLVPEDKIGSIFEDKGSRRPHRHNLISEVQKKWGDVGWIEGYTNAGTFLVSKMHREIFTPINGAYWLGWGSADVHLSYQIHKLGFEVFELEYKWNHMTMFSEPWNGYADRFDSFIIHYAGGGLFDEQNKIRQIEKDITNQRKLK